MKRVTKYALIVVVISFILLIIYLQPIPFYEPAQQPQSAAVGADHKQVATLNTCEQNSPFAAAYLVHAEVDSKLEQQTIYRSQLDFYMQLQEGSRGRILGAATDATISESALGRDIGKPHSLKDVLFLTRTETSQRTIFNKFDDLGLMKQHPLAILSQLLKNLSVGDVGKAYRFTYDQLQREYRYHVSNDNSVEMKRDLSSSTSNPSLSEKLQPLWKATFDGQCLPKSLQAEEVIPIESAGKSGSLRFIMQAERIPDYMDLSSLSYTAQSNMNNRWDVAAVKATDLAPQVSSLKEMWDIFENFQTTKNTASLARASEYLIENLPSDELANRMTEGDMPDDEIRDMIFGLGLSSNAKAEDYMLDLIANLPSNEGGNTDLLKIRLMVAISGNDKVTDKAFNTLASLANDPVESLNIRTNALINMGSTVRQMQTQGNDISGVSNSLNDEITRHMQDNASSSAIFSAGNAGLDNLSQAVTDSVVAKLQSDNQKERYASARVLSSDSSYYDTLIDHLTREPSLLVATAIVSGLQKDQLTGEQRARLQEIGNSAPEQVKHEIDKLLGA